MIIFIEDPKRFPTGLSNMVATGHRWLLGIWKVTSLNWDILEM
jgi:hypothetical protein